MNSTDLSVLVPWVIAHGYLIFWIAATLEGPLTTIAGGVAASLGYFNIFIIMILAIAADLGGDFFYYGIGYACYNFIRSPFFTYIGLNERRLAKVENLLHNHTRRAVFLIKISPLVGPLGIIAVGATRPKFKNFFLPALWMAIPKSIFFVIVGYYSGQTYLELNKTILDKKYTIMTLALVIVLIYIAYMRITAVISKRMEN